MMQDPADQMLFLFCCCQQKQQNLWFQQGGREVLMLQVSLLHHKSMSLAGAAVEGIIFLRSGRQLED